MNNQQIDKIVNFFRINYQFHDPYQLLLDGNFIKLVVEKGFDLQKRLKNSTNGRITLKLLGDDFKLVLQQARKYKLISCKHSLQYSVDSCIVDQIGENNQKFYMVCSQDIQLRRHLRTLQNVPIFYFGPDQRITMEDIPKYSLKQMNKKMISKFLPNQKQLVQLQQYNDQLKQQQKKKRIKELSSQFGIQIKTKIAKGPNPLSVKRRKNKDTNKQQENAGQMKVKRKRIRKNKNKQSQNNQREGRFNENG